MSLTPDQKRRVAQRTTRASKNRLRSRFQRRNQARFERRHPLLFPDQPLRGKTLSRAADALTNLEYGGAKRALGREMTQATRQGTALANNSRDYYSQIAQQAMQGVAREQALGSQLQSQLKTSADEGQAALSQIQQEADQSASQDTALRGAGLSGGGQARVAAEVAAARGLAAQGAQSASQSAAEATYNYGSLQNQTSQATALAGGEAQRQFLNQLGATQADIRGRQGDLAKTIAAKRAANRLDLRQKEFENQITAQGLGIDLAKIQSSERVAAANRRAANRRTRMQQKTTRRGQTLAARTQRRGQDITKRGQDVSAYTQRRSQDMQARERQLDRSSREKIAAGRKRAGKNEPADSRKARREVANILSDIETNNFYRGKPKDAVLKHIRKNKGSPLGAEIAYQLHIRGWLGPELERRARAAGIRIPKAWRHPGGPYGSGIPHNKV